MYSISLPFTLWRTQLLSAYHFKGVVDRALDWAMN